MFDPMLEMLVWAVVVAAIAMLVAFGSEGRLDHLVRMLLGNAPRPSGIDAVVAVPRDEGEWDLLPGAAEQAAEQAAERAAAREAERAARENSVAA